MAGTKSGASGEDILDLAELLGTGGDAAPSRTGTSVPQDSAEIDALLEQMENRSGQAGSVVDGSGVVDGLGREPEDGHRVDPHEQLDMTGMGDMDKLLDSLDMPQRPAHASPAASTPDAELDSAVDEVLNSMGGLDALGDKGSVPAQSAGASLPGGDDILSDLLAQGGQQPAASGSADVDVDALLGVTTPQTPPVAARPAAPVQAAPAQAGGGSGPGRANDDIIELTELIEKGANSAAFAPAEADLGSHMRGLNDKAAMQDSAEIDALLAQMTGGSGQADARADAQAGVQSASDTGDDLGGVDRLLDSLNIPQQPQRPAPAASLDAEVDSAVDEILNSMGAAPAASPKPAPASQPAPADDTAILDDLLAQGQPAPVGGESGQEADFNALLGDLGLADSPATPSAPKPAPAPAAPSGSPAAAAAPDDLDALLGDMGLGGAAPDVKPAPAAAASQAGGSGMGTDDLDALLGDMGLGQPQAAPVAPASAASPAADVADDDLDALLGDIGLGGMASEPEAEHAAVAAASPAASDDAGLEVDELDSLLGTDMPGAVAPASAGGDQAAGAELSGAAVAASAPVAEALVPESSSPASVPSPATVPAAEAVAPVAPAFLAEDWAALLARLDAAEANVQDVARRVAGLEEGFAAAEERSGRVSALEERLAALEGANQSLTTLEDRLSALEATGDASRQTVEQLEQTVAQTAEQVTEQAAVLEKRLEEGLAALEATSQRMAGLEERLATLEMAESSAAEGAEGVRARLEELEAAKQRTADVEERLAALEARFSQDVEQAAAAAAARILREEIARLLEDPAGV